MRVGLTAPTCRRVFFLAQVDEPLGVSSIQVYDRGVVYDLAEDRLGGLDLGKLIVLRLSFHALKFFIQGKLLIAKRVGEPAAELHGGGDGLKERRQLLHWRYGRVVELRRIVSTSVMVCELLGSGECDLAIAGIYLAGKIMGLSGEIENARTSAGRELEFSMVGFPVLGVGGDSSHRLVPGVAVGIDGEGVVLRIGRREIQRKNYAGGVGAHCREPQ